MATFTERAMDALYAFLTDPTTGLNAETLPTMRTDLGIDTDALPDVAVFEKWYHRGGQATAFPYLSLVVSSSGGELEPNSRMYEVTFDVALVVLDRDIDGNEVDVLQASWRYGDAIKTIMQRRVPMGQQGWTLDVATRIIRATVDQQFPGADPTIAADNAAILTTVTIVTAEEY